MPAAPAGLPAERRMFILVGRGRSGGTLLARLLDAHPAIFVAPESLFVLHLFRRYADVRWDAATVHRFAREVWHEERMRRWRLAPQDLAARLTATPGATLARLCAEVYAASAAAHDNPEALWLGDKNPLYALFCGELAELFPQARFVHLVRDYRDNVASFREVPFDLSSVGALAVRWRRYNEAVLAASRGRADRFLRVRFEDLVADPRSVLGRICDFLGVPFSDRILEHRAGRAEEDLPWHGSLAGPLDPSRPGRGRARLAPREIALADRLCQPLGEAFGYPAAPAGPRAARAAAWAGEAVGWATTAAERGLFRLPLAVRVAAIRTYRVATGNRIR